VARVRSSPPARRVGSRGNSVSGTYASRKMGCTIQFESHTVELWAVYTMEYDPQVLEYYDQPTTLELYYQGPSGRPTHARHTPDFLVLRHDGVWLEEWKHEDKLLELAISQPHRYQRDEQGKWRCPPGEEAAQLLGLSYRVRSSAELSPGTIRNLIFLEDYFFAPDVEPTLATHLMDRVRSFPGISLATLKQEQPHVPLDSVFALIARSSLYVDLEATPLIDHESVLLYPDRATAEAHAHLVASRIRTETAFEGERPSRHLALTAGSRVLWDGRIWTLVNLGHTAVTLRPEEGPLMELALSSFLDLIDAGKITVPRAVPSPVMEHLHPEAERLWRSASLRDLEIANQRYPLVQAYRERKSAALAETSVPARTLRSWVARFNEAEATYGTGYVGLLPRTGRSGNRTRKAPQDTHELLDTFIAEQFETSTQPHARAVYHAYCHECQQRGLAVLSERTFYRRLNLRRGTEQTARRKGARAVYQDTPWYWELSRSTPRHGDRPWEIVHLDHSELDIEVCTSMGRVLGRPWATFATDAYSRRLLGCYLSFDPPSYRSCMMVLRACVRRHQRFPQSIVVDGGPEFQSTYFESLVARYNGTKKTRPGAKPRYGSVIERLFGTTNTQFVHNLLGNTQASKQPRLMTKAVDPKGQAVWQLADLYQYLCEWAYQVYDQDTHETLGVSPREAYVTGLELGGARVHRRVIYDEEFVMATLPSPRNQTAKVVPGKGVKLHYLFYWHDALRHPEVEGTRVPIRYDPFNVGIAYAYVRGQWVRCISQYYAAFAGHSEKELELATEILRQQARISHKAVSLTPQRLADFLADVHAHQRVLVQRLRDLEAQGVLESLEADTARKPPEILQRAISPALSLEPVDLTALPVFEEYR
ncbi:MAG: TnsA endonuclease N-terminal domain-containing protein, partial [Ktedonobacteraceae bacterium]